MRYIKSYDNYINEELSIKKLLTTAALTTLPLYSSANIEHKIDTPIVQSISNEDLFEKTLKESILMTMTSTTIESKKPLERYYSFKTYEGYLVNKDKREFNVLLKNSQEKSKQWWINYLNDELTKVYLSRYHALNEKGVDDLIKKYLDIINNVEINLLDSEILQKKFPSSGFERTLGFILNDVRFENKIFINIQKSYDKDIEELSCMISHEIHHLIDQEFETTPYQLIENFFSPNGKRYEDTLSALKNNFDIENDSLLQDFKYSLQSLIGKYSDDLIKPVEMNAWKTDMQRIFGKGSDQSRYEIKKEDVKNYIINVLIPLSKKKKVKIGRADSSVDLFLINWIKEGFPDLEQMIQGLNLMVEKPNLKTRDKKYIS